MSEPVSTALVAPAIAGIVLAGIGNLADAMKQTNPWHGFVSDDANLTSYRVQYVESASCEKWIAALQADPRGSRFDPAKGWAEWEPWGEDDSDAVKDCDDYPCDIKVNKSEAQQMKDAAETARMAKFQSIVAGRAEHYARTNQRKEYEFPGDPVDPWAYIEKAGLKSTLKPPSRAELWIRKFNFDPKRMKTLHQILDRRTARSPSGREAALWVRDAYTDHYFDGWGEWATVVCDPKGEKAGVTVIQALFLECDLLKKTDLISRLARGKLRGGIEEHGGKYLDANFERMRDRAR